MVKFKPWGLIVCEISIRITLVNSFFFFFPLSLQMKEKYLTWFNVFFFFKHHEQASVPCDWDGCLYYTGGKRQNLTTLPLFPTWQTRIWKAFFFFFRAAWSFLSERLALHNLLHLSAWWMLQNLDNLPHFW